MSALASGEPRVSVVVTAYEEGDAILPHLDRIFEAVTLPCEVLVVCDSPDDSTMPWIEKYAESEPRLVPTVNTYGRGPARASSGSWLLRYWPRAVTTFASCAEHVGARTSSSG